MIVGQFRGGCHQAFDAFVVFDKAVDLSRTVGTNIGVNVFQSLIFGDFKRFGFGNESFGA